MRDFHMIPLLVGKSNGGGFRDTLECQQQQQQNYLVSLDEDGRYCKVKNDLIFKSGRKLF